MKRSYPIILSFFMLYSCSTETLQEEIECVLGKAVEEKTDELIDGIIISATQEGKAAADELVKNGEDLVNGWLGTRVVLGPI